MTCDSDPVRVCEVAESSPPGTRVGELPHVVFISVIAAGI